MRRWLPVIIILLVTGVAAGVLLDSQSNDEGKEHATVTIRKTSIRTEVVRDPEVQARGLSGRTGLENETGMLFVFDPADDALAFWMDGMLFNLDIIWVVDGRIAQIDRRVPYPQSGTEPVIRYGPRVPVSAVLEVPASTADEWEIGDSVDITY